MSRRDVYSFDVGVSSHEHLRGGITVLHWTRVQVYAPEGYTTAGLIACETAAAGGWMPTALMYVE